MTQTLPLWYGQTQKIPQLQSVLHREHYLFFLMEKGSDDDYDDTYKHTVA